MNIRGMALITVYKIVQVLEGPLLFILNFVLQHSVMRKVVVFQLVTIRRITIFKARLKGLMKWRKLKHCNIC